LETYASQRPSGEIRAADSFAADLTSGSGARSAPVRGTSQMSEPDDDIAE
jgi:hypothetical protein